LGGRRRSRGVGTGPGRCRVSRLRHAQGPGGAASVVSERSIAVDSAVRESRGTPALAGLCFGARRSIAGVRPRRPAILAGRVAMEFTAAPALSLQGIASGARRFSGTGSFLHRRPGAATVAVGQIGQSCVSTRAAAADASACGRVRPEKARHVTREAHQDEHERLPCSPRILGFRSAVSCRRPSPRSANVHGE
jgi:hypothetical protein